jgi:hypothetical protein
VNPLRVSLTEDSAEHYLSATGAILQDLEDEGIAIIKSLLLQLDKALGTSQVLVSGGLANLTLSKRSVANFFLDFLERKIKILSVRGDFISESFKSLINRRFVKNLTPLGKSKVGETTRHKNLGSS